MDRKKQLSDAEVVRRAVAAVELELEKKRILGIPYVIYDSSDQTIYKVYSDGHREPIGKRLRKERYSERIKKQA